MVKGEGTTANQPLLRREEAKLDVIRIRPQSVSACPAPCPIDGHGLNAATAWPPLRRTPSTSRGFGEVAPSTPIRGGTSSGTSDLVVGVRDGPVGAEFVEAF